MDRNQFTFYGSFYQAISRIKKRDVRCMAYDAICSYALTGEMPDIEALPDAAAIAFDLIKPNLDASRRKAESGKRGGNNKQKESKPKANRKQTATESEGEKKKEKEKEKEKEVENECYTPPTPPRGQDAFAEFAGDNEILLASLRDFEEMRKKDRHPMTERAKQILVKKLCELSKDVNEQIAILEQSTVSNWKSVYPLKQETQSSGQASQKKEFVFDEQWMREVGITCG